MRAARTDANHREVVDTIRQLGVTVRDLSGVGDGIPDCVVLLRGRAVFVEIKTTRGKLKPKQLAFQAEGWPVRVIRSVDEAIQMIQACRG
jgi:Holliday junction resolvase